MARNKYGQPIPNGTGIATFEFNVISKLKNLKDTLFRVLGVLSQDKDAEILVVQVKHSDNSTEIMKEVTDYKTLETKYYYADGTEYTKQTGDEFTYVNYYDALAVLSQNTGQKTFHLFFTQVTNQTQDIDDSKQGSITNDGTADITIVGYDANSNTTSMTLKPGSTLEWGNEGSYDKFGKIRVVATGGSALVYYVK